MPNVAKGEVRKSRDGKLSARITLGRKVRETYELPTCKTEPEAEERAKVLSELAQRFRRAQVIDTPEARKLLETAATCAAARLPGVLTVAQELIGGELVRVDEHRVKTFAELAKEWTDGTLHREFPDHVKAKEGADQDASRLGKLGAINVGGTTLGAVPLDRFTLDHAQEAMKHLPEEAKRPATRRAYALLMNRVLALAVFPCRIIAGNPLPKGFVPSAGKAPAYPFLYPSEDLALLTCRDVPLCLRVLFGFLSREGCRYGEARAMQFSDFDFDRGVLRLDKNKTDDPRAWALDPGVNAALKAWSKYRDAKPGDRVFVDDRGRALGPESLVDELRNGLLAAGIARKELHEAGTNWGKLRVHDLRGTFVTLSLANGRTETWVADRTGHKSSQMINRYRRAARHAAELELGPLESMAKIPELAAMAPPWPLGPSPLESTDSLSSVFSAALVVGHDRLELSANGLRVRCSTN